MISEINTEIVAKIRGGKQITTGGTEYDDVTKKTKFDRWDDENNNGIFDEGDCFTVYWVLLA